MKLEAVLCGICRWVAAACGDGMPLSFEGTGTIGAPRVVVGIGLICDEPEDSAKKVGEDRESEEEGEKEECVAAWQLTGAAGEDLVAASVDGLRMSDPRQVGTPAGALLGVAATAGEEAEVAAGVLKLLFFAGSDWDPTAAVLALSAVLGGGSALTSACLLTDCGALAGSSNLAALFFLAVSAASVFFRFNSPSFSKSSFAGSFLTGSPAFGATFLSGRPLASLLPSVSSVSRQVAHLHFFV
jgi:hypothetical protein